MGKARLFILPVLCSVLLYFGAGCKDKPKPNMVDMEQFEFDGSSNDRYLFKEYMEEQKARREQYKKDDF